MRKTLTILLLMPFGLLAGETFEINQKNCNLPMKEIKKRLPDPSDQRNALKKCMEKASKEKWKRRTLRKIVQ